MLLPHDPCWGSNPKPQAPDMMGNQPVTSLVYGMAVNQLSHNGQAQIDPFQTNMSCLGASLRGPSCAHAWVSTPAFTYTARFEKSKASRQLVSFPDAVIIKSESPIGKQLLPGREGMNPWAQHLSQSLPREVQCPCPCTRPSLVAPRLSSVASALSVSLTRKPQRNPLPPSDGSLPFSGFLLCFQSASGGSCHLPLKPAHFTSLPDEVAYASHLEIGAKYRQGALIDLAQ